MSPPGVVPSAEPGVSPERRRRDWPPPKGKACISCKPALDTSILDTRRGHPGGTSAALRGVYLAVLPPLGATVSTRSREGTCWVWGGAGGASLRWAGLLELGPLIPGTSAWRGLWGEGRGPVSQGERDVDEALQPWGFTQRMCLCPAGQLGSRMRGRWNTKRRARETGRQGGQQRGRQGGQREDRREDSKEDSDRGTTGRSAERAREPRWARPGPAREHPPTTSGRWADRQRPRAGRAERAPSHPHPTAPGSSRARPAPASPRPLPPLLGHLRRVRAPEPLPSPGVRARAHCTLLGQVRPGRCRLRRRGHLGGERRGEQRADRAGGRRGTATAPGSACTAAAESPDGGRTLAPADPRPTSTGRSDPRAQHRVWEPKQRAATRGEKEQGLGAGPATDARAGRAEATGRRRGRGQPGRARLASREPAGERRALPGRRGGPRRRSGAGAAPSPLSGGRWRRRFMNGAT